MTTNGRGDSNSDRRETGENERSDEGSSQPSGVFRASGEQKRRDSGWTVTEQFEREGFTYRLMRRPLESAKVAPRLTKREEDALVLAGNGHSNKSIAEALDVSPSTVGVLLFRAAAKLNATSRSELLASYEQFKAAVSAANTAPDDDPERTK